MRSRRQFLSDASKALGGLALVHASPTWAFATGLPTSDIVHRTGSAMGTSIRVSMRSSEFVASAVDTAFARLQDVDRLLTVYSDASSLMRMNAGPGQWIEGSELADVTAAALRFGSLSEGAMDVTVLPAVRRLGFAPGVSFDGSIDFTRLEVREDEARITGDIAGADFGGIAKGFGVDEAIKVVREAGGSAALIDAGGDLFALGRPVADRRWNVGIRHPHETEGLVATLEIENEAVATSGTYVNQKVIDGQTVSHLIDPRTGRSVNHVVSATIVAANTMTADALATAVSVMDKTAGQDLIQNLPGVEGFLIYEDGTHHISNGLINRLTML